MSAGRKPLAVGDPLWLVMDHGRRNVFGYPVVVTKVGRKWAHLGAPDGVECGYPRIDLETWECDGAGYSSPGGCYTSQEEYERRVRRNEAWDMLKRRVREQHAVPDHLTVANIDAINALLDAPSTNGDHHA